MVSLSTDREDPSNHHHCGGTLVSSHYVVTAASCVTWPEEDGSAAVMSSSNLWVTLGEHRTSDQNETHMENIIGVANIYIHGGFNKKHTLHDIALLELDTVVNLYNYAPACLASTQDYFDGLMAQVYGFGVFDSDDNEGTLHEANVTIVNSTVCSAAIGSGMLCAGAGGDTEKGPCEVRLKKEKSQLKQWQKQTYFRLGDTLTRGVL